MDDAAYEQPVSNLEHSYENPDDDENPQDSWHILTHTIGAYEEPVPLDTRPRSQPTSTTPTSSNALSGNPHSIFMSHPRSNTSTGASHTSSNNDEVYNNLHDQHQRYNEY